MHLTLLKCKLHRATVTDSDLNYEGSVTIDPALMEAADILPFEKIDVLNINNGERFTTYAITSEQRGAGDVINNGAAARLVQKGDLVIICAFAEMDAQLAESWQPTVVLLDAQNPPLRHEDAA